ncbi:MAG: M81 family metallopeptidase [Rhodobacteraceae bacterium]|jgi:microcystin degradation protein MlrC|nr:M81 family metallopeptidase [Paracoccaceae bacterium]
MRLFIASLATETNSFATFPTGIEDYRSRQWIDGGILRATPMPGTAPLQHWVRRAQGLGWEVVEGLCARAAPSGITTRTAYETMRDRILSQARAALPLDAMLLYLHGAMIAEGYDDCEADLVTRLRAIVGPRCRIGVELDLHANLDEVLLGAADLIVFYKAYPHIDYTERAEDLFVLMQRTLAGEIEPVMALFDCRTIGIFPCTWPGPMGHFVAAMTAAEGKGGILSLSLNHGFPWADVPQAGAKMLAVADRSAEVARRAAEEFGRRFYAIRKAAMLPFTPFEDAIAEAGRGRPGDRPLMLLDTSDQIGSGAPGDTTHILRALIAAGIREAAVVPLWDPLAVGICMGVGAGARLPLRIGGKFEPQSGPCHDAAEAEVLFVKRDAFQNQLASERIPLGDIAVVRVEGIEVMLTSRRSNVYDPSIFALHGIDIASKRVISVKNLFKQYDLFKPLVRDQLFVASPGTSNPDWTALPFGRLPRPVWPLDPDPLGLD